MTGSRNRTAAAALLISFVLAGGARAGTTGRISGRVIDPAKQPLGGANVAIPAARTGAVTDAEGRYSIINVPAGTYDVRVSLIGYQTVLTQEVVVSADNTTVLDLTLKPTPVQLQEVVVSAERPVVDVNQTSQIATVSRKEINQLPVQELQDVVNLQAGVVEGHFRGGRIGEVQYQVDGVTVNNPYDNKSTLKLDRALLEEVQVISGTFDAEYGQAMSGVVNAVLRSGGDRFRWDAEAFAGGYYYSDGEAALTDILEPRGLTRRIVPYEFRPVDIQNYQLTLSGPTGLPQTNFLVTGRYYSSDDWVRGVRRFVPTDKSDFENKVFVGTGDSSTVPLGFTRDFSGVGKLTNHSLRNKTFGYQAIWNAIHGRRNTNAFWLNPDGLPEQHTFSIVHGLDFTHALDKNSFYNLNVRQNYFDYRDMVYDDLYDPRYDAAGQARGDPDYNFGAYVQGVDFTRFTQTTNALVVKGSYENQSFRDHRFKVGGEYQFSALEFGNPGYLVFTNVPGTQEQVLVRHVDDPPNYPAVSKYGPVSVAGFGQDEIEWNNLRLRAGVRFDWFDARTHLPSDLANPANSIPDVPQSEQKPTSNKISFSPRLGVSYPVTRDAALYFAYGHFSQMPALGTMFNNANYDKLAGLQADPEAEAKIGVMGNPDVKPEKTVQYQFGYKQALSSWIGLDVSAFYKDIRSLLGVEFIETYNGAQYARLTNVDFGNVVGFTLSLDQRQLGWVTSTMDYTWQFAQGNSSDPNETATRAEAGEDPRPRLVPLNWDQRHTFNMTVDVSWPRRFRTSAVMRAGSGQPYTPALTAGFAGGIETNSGRKPAGFLLDLRGERPTLIGKTGVTFFARVFNVFDTRFWHGSVYSSSGSPYYSRYPAADVASLVDPTRYYSPRRIEIGIGLRGNETR
ncbi:MAG TPA: TonB-dependent receptor [Candidatus Eisenbacteria bacterium]|nr:TonB-dependent receptor [Candidatus Eisenbacteria bacterium]